MRKGRILFKALRDLNQRCTSACYLAGINQRVEIKKNISVLFASIFGFQCYNIRDLKILKREEEVEDNI
jgi:hypothetical protein